MPNEIQDIKDFIQSIGFRFIQPHDVMTEDFLNNLMFLLQKDGIQLDMEFEDLLSDLPLLSSEKRKKLISLEFLNTAFKDEEIYKKRLSKIALMPRMASLSIGVIINKIVSELKDDEVFLNVGTWCGFSLIAGMIDNPTKRCIGVDNFSQFTQTPIGHPKDIFLRFFQLYSTENHRFFELDYEEYFEKMHNENIGFYYYDGEHSYENQLKGLELADPYLRESSLVLIDDINIEDVQRASLDFVKRSKRYEIIFQQKTAHNEHMTFWNGIMLLVKTK